MVDFTSTYWKWRILWNTTSFSQFLVSVVFHNNPKCFFKHQQETLFHYIVLKTWFWALIRAKNETNRTCWSQNENTPKDWRSLTLNILLSCPPRIVRLIFSNSLETQLWFSANLKTQKFPIPVKTLKVLQIIWLRRNWDLPLLTFSKLERLLGGI